MTFVIAKIQLKNCQSETISDKETKRRHHYLTRKIYLRDQKIFSIQNQISDIFIQNS